MHKRGGLLRTFISSTDLRSKSCDQPESLDIRPLKFVPAAPPDFIINPVYLTEKCVEIESRFAGTLSNIENNIDMSQRATILKYLDNGFQSKELSCSELVIVSLSIYNIRITKRCLPEELICRIPTEEIDSIVYVRDDIGHLVVIYHTSSIPTNIETSAAAKLTVLNCDSRLIALEICSITKQCFQLVYTEATMQFFDSQLNDVLPTVDMFSPAYSSSKNSIKPVQNTVAKVNPLNNNLIDNVSVHSDSDLSSVAADLLQDYMNKLHSVLDTDELRQFATLLSNWHSGTPFSAFCDSLYKLFTPQRSYLLSRMHSFIPQADCVYFRNFLERHGIALPDSKLYSPYAQNVSNYSTWSSSSSFNSNNFEFGDVMFPVMNEDMDLLNRSCTPIALNSAGVYSKK